MIGSTRIRFCFKILLTNIRHMYSMRYFSKDFIEQDMICFFIHSSFAANRKRVKKGICFKLCKINV